MTASPRSAPGGDLRLSAARDIVLSAGIGASSEDTETRSSSGAVGLNFSASNGGIGVNMAANASPQDEDHYIAKEQSQQQLEREPVHRRQGQKRQHPGERRPGRVQRRLRPRADLTCEATPIVGKHTGLEALRLPHDYFQRQLHCP